MLLSFGVLTRKKHLVVVDKKIWSFRLNMRIGYQNFNLIVFVFFNIVHHTASTKRTSKDTRKSWVPLEKISYHKRLIADLLDHRDYNKNVRPVKDSKSGIDVYINQKLVQILEVNERGQYVALNLWTTISWYDEFLAWNPEHYDNIESIIVPYDQIWRPDTIVDNSLMMNPKFSERHWYLKLKMNVNETKTKALVTYTYPAIYNFTCLMDVSRFPFDTQNCSLFFSSWSYNADQMRFVAVPGDEKENIKETEEWNIISFEVHTLDIPSALGTTSVVDLKLVMQRKSIYYIVNMVIPTILITFVALLGFFSPSSSTAKRKEKMMLGINTLLAMSVLQLAISDTMPISSNNVPLIGAFFVSIMILTSFATGTTASVINTEKSGHYGHKLTSNVKHLVRSRTGRFLGSKAPPETHRRHHSQRRHHPQEFNFANFDLSPKNSTVFYDEKIMKTFEKLTVEMTKLQKYYNAQVEKETSELEWQWFGNMIDRILFIVFCSLLVLLAILFFSFGT